MKNELENDENVLDGYFNTSYHRKSTFDRQTSGKARFDSEDEDQFQSQLLPVNQNFSFIKSEKSLKRLETNVSISERYESSGSDRSKISQAGDESESQVKKQMLGACRPIDFF